MPLTLSDLADAQINLSLRCLTCGHQVVEHARTLLERSGDTRLDRFVRRVKCAKCQHQAVEIIMVVTPGTSPELSGIRAPRWRQNAPFLTIDECDPGGTYYTLLATHNQDAAHAAWGVLSELHPRSELVLRHGTMVQKQRKPTDGLS